MNPDQYCWEKTKKSKSNFYYSFLTLPKTKRRAIIALYSFCREVDDIVDNSKNPELAHLKLNWWQQEVQSLFDGKPNHPVSLALAPHIESKRLQEEHFQKIIDGMRMDLTIFRYKNFKELKNYCYHAAGVVGILAAQIFGYSNPDTLDFAVELGIALQLTNIIRDVGEDANRGRIYLPLEEMNKFEISETEILQLADTKNMEKLIFFQLARAESFYDRAFTMLPRSDSRNQKTSLIIANIYFALLQKMKRNRPKIGCKINLTQWEKIGVAVKTWIVC